MHIALLFYYGLSIFLVLFLFVIIKEFLFPTRTRSHRIVESKKKLETQLAKIKEKEERLAEEKLQKKESRLCPRMSTRTDDKYNAYFRRIWCYQGTVFSHMKKWRKEGECAMASECPGAYHKTLQNKTLTKLSNHD